ncbi:MAG: DinB family protein [Balneolaceae bacterium]|nr:DinB family protein [Balneolaceae bacterium]
MRQIPEIKSGLNQAFDKVIQHVEAQPDHLFESSIADGKWTTGQQLEHLIKSVTPIILGLSGPAILLKVRFGTIKRAEMTFEELQDVYHKKLNEGAKASAPYIPDPVPLSAKTALLKSFHKKKLKLLKQIDRWSEKELSEIGGKHPVLGLLSIRELLYFTEFHTLHHLESIRRIG